jgi:hypothetical protein
MEEELATARRYLKALDLEPGATWEEVKQAYRTMAQVWHPDRFPEGRSVHAAAEEKLKEINAAYGWLARHRAVLGSFAGAPPSGERSRDPAWDTAYDPFPAAAARATRRRRSTQIGWLQGIAVAGIVGIGVGLLVLSSRDVGVPFGSLWEPRSADGVNYTAAGRANLQGGPAGDSSIVGVRDGFPKTPSLAGLSAAEWRMVESACQPEKAEDPKAYYGCLRNHVSELEGSVGRPDLSGLTLKERRMVESACSSDGREGGPAAYYRCLTILWAELTESSGKPDLSGLSAGERETVESTCRPEADVAGPAAYYRCLRDGLTEIEARTSETRGAS